MKKIFTICLAMSMVVLSFAQRTLSDAQPLVGKHVLQQSATTADPASLAKAKFQHGFQGNGNRAQNTSFFLDYGYVDQLYAQELQTDYLDDAIARIHRNLPVDSDNVMKWAFQWYPRILDADNITAWPPIEYPSANINMMIDTVWATIGHINNSGQPDTIVVSIWDLDALQTISVADSGCTGVLYGRMQLVVDTSLTGAGTQPGTIQIGNFPIVPAAPIAIPQGKNFIAQVDFFGPAGDEFYVLVTRRNDCGNTCASVPYVNENYNAQLDSFNSCAGMRYVDPQGTNTGVYPINLFYNDCNQNNAQDADNCERIYFQNMALFPHLQVSIPNFFVAATASKTAGCEGEVITLNATAGGSSSTPYSYSWTISSGSGTLQSNSDPSVQFTIGNSNAVIIVTTTDASNVTTADTITINSRAININIAQNPTPLQCGSTANLTSSISGYTTGPETYIWNTGVTTTSITVSTAGNYSITVTNSAGCTASNTVAVQYPGNLTNNVNFNLPNPPNCAGKPITFVNTSARTQGWSFAWDFGDNSGIAFTQDGVYTYPSQGQYVVTLVQDSASCKFSSPAKTINIASATSTACLTGIDDVNFSNGVAIVPNPTNGNVNISVNAVEKNLTIRVYNIIGSEVKAFNTSDVSSTFNRTFDFSDLANGTYLVKIQTADKTAVKRLTISK